MAAVAAILDFANGTTLAIFYLQVTPILSTKFQVNWPFNLGALPVFIAEASDLVSFKQGLSKIKF